MNFIIYVNKHDFFSGEATRKSIFHFKVIFFLQVTGPSSTINRNVVQGGHVGLNVVNQERAELQMRASKDHGDVPAKSMVSCKY